MMDFDRDTLRELRGWRRILELTLCDYFRWARRLVGGRWERWYVDHPVCSDSWHPTTGASGRPTSICRGTPVVEVWP